MPLLEFHINRITQLVVVLEVPNTTLRLDDFLGFTGLRKAVILLVTVYHDERIQIKLSKGQ